MIAEPEGLRLYDLVTDPGEQHPKKVTDEAQTCLANLGEKLIHEEELRSVADASTQIDSTVL
jgi:hypothetical protein